VHKRLKNPGLDPRFAAIIVIRCATLKKKIRKTISSAARRFAEMTDKYVEQAKASVSARRDPRV
jgi:hypothetical protein